MFYASWSKEAALDVLATTCDEPGPVLISLQALQAHFGYVPQAAIALVADACNVSRADVHGVLTFYHDLRTSPPPKVHIRLCAAEACQAVGSRELARAVEENFAVGLRGGTVEIEAAYCFGNCALGPAAMVNGKLIGRTNIEALVAAVEGGVLS